MPVWLLTAMVGSLIVGSSCIPRPGIDTVGIDESLIALPDASGEAAITRMQPRAIYRIDDGSVLAMVRFQLGHDVRGAELDRIDSDFLPMHQHVWCRTSILRNGAGDMLLGESDPIWTPVRAFLIAHHSELGSLGSPIPPNMDRPEEIWWPGVGYNASIIVRGFLWFILGAAALRFFIPSPFNAAARRRADGLCPRCAYPVAASGSKACPECGAAC